MKTYDFAKLQARWFPTTVEVNNQYIYGNVEYVINVSTKEYPEEVADAMKKCRIKSYHFPLVETGNDMGLDNILKAVKVLMEANREGAAAVVHCDWGNNRSRVVAECFHYVKTGTHFIDEYKGEMNHLAWNCEQGHLPELKEMEQILKQL